MKKRKSASILFSLSLSFSTAAGMLLPASSSSILAQSQSGVADQSEYESWEDFIKTADPATGVITLNGPDKTVTINSGACELYDSLTLDLNGNTLTLPTGEPINVEKGAVLTINDSSGDAQKPYSGQIQSGSKARNLSMAVLYLNGGTVNLNGGIIYSSSQSTNCSVYSNDSDSLLNVKGGAVINGSHFGSIVFMKGRINIESGYILSETGTAIFIDTAKEVDENSPANFTMSGGMVGVRNVVPYGSALFLSGAVADISGGLLQYGETRNEEYDYYSTDYQAAAIEAGLWNNAIVNISGNAILRANSSGQASAIGIRTERSAQSHPGIISPHSVQNPSISHVHITGGVISGQSAGIQAWANTHVEMSGGSIADSHIGIVASQISDAGQIDISDTASIKADENGVGAYVSGGTINIEGGSVSGGIGILAESAIGENGYQPAGVLNITGGSIYGTGGQNQSITPFKGSGSYTIASPATVIYNLSSGEIPQSADPIEILEHGTYYTKSLYPVLVTQNGKIPTGKITDINSPLLVGTGSLFDMMVNYRFLDTRQENAIMPLSVLDQEDLGQIQKGYLGLFEYYPDSENPSESKAYGVLEDNPGYVYTSNQILAYQYKEGNGTTFKLSLNANGGTLESNGTQGETITYRILQGSVIHLPVPVKEGFVFKGFSKSRQSRDFVNTIYTPDQNQTLYAIWGNGSNNPDESNPGDKPNQPDENNPGESNPGDNNPDENHPGENNPEDQPDENPDTPLWPGYPTPPTPDEPDSPGEPTPPATGPGITEPGTQYYPVPDDKYYIIYYMPEDESYRTITVTNSPDSIESLGSIIQIQQVPDDNSFQNPIEIFLGVNAQGKPVGIPGNKLPENGPKVSISFHQISRSILKPVVSIPIIPGTEMPGTVSIDDHDPLPKSVMEGNNLKMPVENGSILTIANNARAFRDAKVYGADYAQTAVAFMSARGMMTGVGNGENFDLTGVSTRQQFATILYRYESSPNVSGMTLPEGVLPDAWFTDAAKWAVNQDLMAQGSKFDGSRLISRQDLAVILYRLQGGNPTADLSLLNNYLDKDKVSGYARIPVAWAIEHHILGQGTHGLIDPLDDSERIEMAAMIQRFILNVYEN